MGLLDRWARRVLGAKTFGTRFGSITMEEKMNPQDMYANQAMQNAPTGPGMAQQIGSSISAAQNAQNAAIQNQMHQLAGISAVYRGKEEAKYRRTTFSVQEISNGYVVVLGEEQYYCEDVAAVGSRVTTILATQVLAK